MTMVLQKFELRLADNASRDNPGVPGLVVCPEVFEMSFKPIKK